MVVSLSRKVAVDSGVSEAEAAGSRLARERFFLLSVAPALRSARAAVMMLRPESAVVTFSELSLETVV